MLNTITEWKLLLIAPVAIGSAVLVSGSAIATETVTKVSPSTAVTNVTTAKQIQPQPILTAVTNVTTVNQVKSPSITLPVPAVVAQTTDQALTPIMPDPNADQAPTGMEQVNSVSQLTDVKPSDWAFTALQALVERYGCIAGYPDKTYRGNRAMTRYEFAAGLNACLNRINELIAAGTADLATKSDLATLQKLRSEFATELTALRGRVDQVESRISAQENQQFSTTTKLNGLTWINLTGAAAGGNVKFEALPGPNNTTPAAAPGGGVRFAGRNADGTPVVQRTDRANTTLSFFSTLTLNTSFSGKDSLVTQLSAGNGISPYNQFASAGFFNAGGVPFTDQTAGTNNGSADLIIRELFYQFPVGKNVQVAVGPRVNWYRYFDFNRFTFFLTGASSFDSIGSTLTNAIDRGSGAVVVWNPSKKIRLAAAYLGENTEFLPGSIPGFNTSSNPNYGLFGGSNTTTAELTYSPTDKFNLRLGYNYSRLQGIFGQVGGSVGEPLPYGEVDAGPEFARANGFSGGLDHANAHTFTANFDWLLTPKFGIFGRYGYGTTTLEPITKVVNTQAFQVGLGFPDLGKKGALGVVTFLMPMDIMKGRKYFASGGGDGGTQYELEASYYYPVTDHLALVPAFYAIFHPNNFDSNPTVYVGNLRTQFSF